MPLANNQGQLPFILLGAGQCATVFSMARFARVVMPGTPCHITQRRNNQQDVFFVDDDRRVYLELLQVQSRITTSSSGCTFPRVIFFTPVNAAHLTPL